MARPLAPRLATLAAAAALPLALAAPAFAHVTVQPGELPKGGFSQLTFRVPNERDDAGTTKVEVTFPIDKPLAFVSVRPVPGWTAKVDKTKLATPVKSDDGDVTEAVSKITWTGGPIKPGEYQNFDVSAGPLPKDADQLSFKAVQTYGNGEVVRWIQDAPEGGPEPQNPAPVLKLIDAPAVTPAGTVTAVGTQPVPAAQTAPAQADVDNAKRLASIGLASGLLGLLAGLVALVVALLALAVARRGPGADAG